MKLKLILLLTTISFGHLYAQTNSKLPKEIADAIKTLPNEIDYNIHIKPILSDKCVRMSMARQSQTKSWLTS